jgi:glycogen debranching enzyme
MEEIIRVQDEHYIIATSPRLAERKRVLKHGETFAVFDPSGDILPIGPGEQGIFHEGTRFLSRLEFRLQDRRPFLLSSTIHEQAPILAANLTNPDIFAGDVLGLPRNTLHVRRASFLWEGACYEQLRIRNFGLRPVETRLAFLFDADFRDIFEIRGFAREKRGRILPPVTEPSGDLVLQYEGLDGRLRRLRIRLTPAPTLRELQAVRYERELPPGGEEAVTIVFGFENGAPVASRRSYRQALNFCQAEIRQQRGGDARLTASNATFNDVLARASTDLHMMITRTPWGLYPYAGIPWFSTVFGRDGIVTALEYLFMNPEPARGVLAYLAATQAKEMDPEKDAEPGKILHELRKGELAELGEIPFGRYYGSVDSTPLFIILAGAYYERTGDLAFAERLWPNVQAALDWIDRYGDQDGDGFVEYLGRSRTGLTNHGWKDSYDSVFHADGTLAQGPIALCEVQSYVYLARLSAADLAQAFGHRERADALRRQARELRERFERSFWIESLSTYALALDGQKVPCQVRTSNAGHTLLSGIASPEHARKTVEAFLGETFFSGWGVRTVSTTESRYNPMSYHNGSVWPHDNALLAWGCSRYPGLRLLTLRILSGLFDAAAVAEHQRLPELYCGFRRQPGEGPTLYPVACSPQAWSSGALFMVLGACLGITVDGVRGQVRFDRPSLPEWLEALSLRRLGVGQGREVDLDIVRHTRDVEINVGARKGDVEVVVVK